MTRTILITGASIAGTAMAWFLGRAGNDVTVVERAAGFRTEGQNVDLRGSGREVIRRMGLEDAVRSRGTGETGIAFVDAANRVRARVDLGQFGSDGLTAELEILRGDLADILYQAGLTGRVRFEFGNRVRAVAEDASGIDVSFASGPDRRFDLVIVAEGIGSSTRTLVFGTAATRRDLGLYMGYFTIPAGDTDGTAARWFNAVGGRSAFLRPDNRNTTRVVLTRRGPRTGMEDRTVAEQKAFLRDCFADAGWEMPRVLDGLAAADDFYFERIGQVRMPVWSQGRLVLTGDAAWCASPISGAGTTLALTGAYVLAGELGRTGDHAAAYAGYCEAMRPRVRQAQAVPSFGPRLAQPSTRLGIRLQHAAINLATSAPARWAINRMSGRPSRAPGLPEYPGLTG